jgi:glucans biosynthesis protein
VRRRYVIQALGALSAAALLPGLSFSKDESIAIAAKEATDFSAAIVHSLARELASKQFEPPKTDLPKSVKYDHEQYRQIHFKPELAIWSSEPLPFRVELFHRGFLFANPVALHVVADGKARRLLYSPDLFTFGPRVKPPSEGDLADFSGFRLHAPINQPDRFDEFAVFQGASYFRAAAKGQVYGLSARGLSLRTGDINGEEFPIFRALWIERPSSGASAIVVHALLDSESTSGAYRFTIRPGDPTVTDVEMTLYPRVKLSQVGLATLTSMFLFGPQDRVGVDDFRLAVHDSNGLAIWNGRNEWLWRPLMNPETLQISAFIDENPRGFGLLQRRRAFEDYQDLEARYERRPSLWVEMIGNWGNGAVQLVEIPSKFEGNDNIVAFWRPSEPLPAQTEYRLTYRLHWCWTPPVTPTLATTQATRVGAEPKGGRRQFVIDFTGGRLAELSSDAPVEMVIEHSAGDVGDKFARPNPEIRGWRVSFVFDPGDANFCDIRCYLKLGDERLSEVWIYRWSQ